MVNAVLEAHSLARNLITDVAGVRVGHADDGKLGSGATVVLFDQPAVAAADLRGGGPGTRESALLDPAMTVERIDAIALAGGSAFGLDAASGVQAWLREQGRGFAVREALVPIVPAAILFDLLSGGDKDWGRYPPYRELGYAAIASAAADFALGSVGAGLGATTADLKGGIGSASAQTRDGLTVGALAVVNAAGSAVIGGGPHFWAAPYERDGEFGGRGLPASMPPQALAFQGQGPARREHHPGRGRDRRRPDQAADAAPGHHGAGWHGAGAPADPHPARRRHRVRGGDRRASAGRSDPWPVGVGLACGRRGGARHRPRRLRSAGAVLPWRVAELARRFGPR